MDWKQLLVSITRSVDQELRLRNEYLASENRILRQQIKGRVQLGMVIGKPWPRVARS
jgi:hypothetical protein